MKVKLNASGRDTPACGVKAVARVCRRMPSLARRLVRYVLFPLVVVTLSRVLAATGHFGDGVALLLFALGGVMLLGILASRVR